MNKRTKEAAEDVTAYLGLDAPNTNTNPVGSKSVVEPVALSERDEWMFGQGHKAGRTMAGGNTTWLLKNAPPPDIQGGIFWKAYAAEQKLLHYDTVERLTKELDVAYGRMKLMYDDLLRLEAWFVGEDWQPNYTQLASWFDKDGKAIRGQGDD